MRIEELTPEQQATYSEYIKVNLTKCKDDEKDSAGEGVWCLVTKETKAAHDTDETGTEYEAVLDNDSFEYPGLIHGEIMPIRMNGEKRPIVPFNWLLEHYGAPQL